MHYFTDGGPAMYAIAIHGLALVLWVAIRTRGRPWQQWFDAAAAWCASLLSLGALSTSMGLLLTLQAVSQASPGAKSAMLRQGLQVSYYSAGQTLVWCALATVLALGLQLGSKPDRAVPHRHRLQWLATLTLGLLAFSPLVWLGSFHAAFYATAQSGNALALEAATTTPFYAIGAATLTIVLAWAYAPVRWLLGLGQAAPTADLH